MRIVLLVFFVSGLIFPFPAQGWTQTRDGLPDDLDLDFHIEEIEKKTFDINMDVEVEQTLSFFDQDAIFYKQKFLNQDRDSAWQTEFDATLEAQYQKDDITLYSRIKGLFSYDRDVKSQYDSKAEELYLSYQPSHSFAVEAGKKVHKWGKGYAFSPNAFFSRTKDPDNPDATLEGYYTISIDYIKSMKGSLKTFAATPVLMPVTKEINSILGPENELIWGAKFYFFAFDTDFDLMFQISENLQDRFGVDFSKNLSPSFEIHADAALIMDYQQCILGPDGAERKEKFNAASLLLGIRYLSPKETTYILEYYRNGQGYSGKEYKEYLGLIEKGYEDYLDSSSLEALKKTRSYSSFYNKQGAMKDYLYLKVSQKEPFDILYLTPGVSLIYNMDDQSCSITPQVAYSPRTNLTLDLKSKFLVGSSYTEYGEKVSSAVITASIRFYF